MRDRRVLASTTLVVVIAAVVVIVLLTGSSTPSSAAGSSPSVSGAATVQRRDLVETDTESGTVSYSNPQTVYDRLSGTVTWLPSVGQLIKPGQALFAVDNAPVVLMDGSTPAYRNLDPADSAGPDVTELNRNLVKLGFAADDIAVDDEWQTGTTVGVEELQASEGQAETGTLTLGQVVFLPGAQLISTVEGTVGATSGGSSSGATASLIDPPSRPEFVSMTTTKPATTTPATGTVTTTTTTPSRAKTRHKKHGGAPTSREQLQALLALLRAEVAELHSSHNPSSGPSKSSSSNPSSSGGKSSSAGKKSSGGKKSSSSATGSTTGSSGSSGNSGGSSGGNASAILQTSSDHLIVTVDLAATSQSEAKVGEPVTVEMPAGNTMSGVITQVSSVAQTSSNSGSGGNSGGGSGGGGSGGSGSTATVPVTIALHGHVRGAGLDQAAVSVNFAEAKAKNVLSVPVTALLATSGNTYAVQEANPPHKLIPVTTGLFAAGYVAISGPGIYTGLQVTDSQG